MQDKKKSTNALTVKDKKCSAGKARDGGSLLEWYKWTNRGKPPAFEPASLLVAASGQSPALHFTRSGPTSCKLFDLLVLTLNMAPTWGSFTLLWLPNQCTGRQLGSLSRSQKFKATASYRL